MLISPKSSVQRKIEESPAVAVHGQVATQPHVVDLIFDLVGYAPERPLHTFTLLDPGCGEGAFIVEAATRLLKTAPKPFDVEALAPALLGVEKDERAAAVARARLREVLALGGVPPLCAATLARQWVLCGDFLEHRFERQFHFVVGNPPYVRQEAIPKADLQRYRKEFRCFYDRADLYVAFFERGLDLLANGGTVGFICPDRFARNNYGRKLREYITSKFAVRTVVDLAQASPFQPAVCCYPGIFVVSRSEPQGVNHLRLTDATPAECRAVQMMLEEGVEADQEKDGVAYHYYEHWFEGEQQWATESPAHLALLRKLEQIGPALGSEASGCKVGIGVATGADKVFIVRKDQVDIETELLVPLIMTDDIKGGEVAWRGRYVISPFDPEEPQKLIDLGKYPKAKRYFQEHQTALKNRNVAKRSESSLRDGWYRTIDRIYPELRTTPKLLIPDIKAKNLIVLEPGDLYPHHNLYYVASDKWDLAVLRSVLRSSVAKFFVWMYGVKMRGNFLRFQAQYLRKIRLPNLDSVGRNLLKRLQQVPATAPTEEIDPLVAELYGLSADEMDLIRDISE